MLETGNVKQRRCTPVVVQAQAVEPGCALPVHHAADHGWAHRTPAYQDLHRQRNRKIVQGQVHEVREGFGWAAAIDGRHEKVLELFYFCVL